MIPKELRSVCFPLSFFRVLKTCGALVILPALFALTVVESTASAQQTREQCRQCCSGKGYDEYYAEQCRLKCFRSPEHCRDGQPTPDPIAAKPDAGRPKPAPAEQPQTREPSGPPPQTAGPAATRPPAARKQQQPERPPAARAPKSRFNWPQALSVTPGKEWEAAAQILAANGVNPKHPNFPQVLKAIEAILVDFTRNNPQGGRLPVTQLEKTLRAGIGARPSQPAPPAPSGPPPVGAPGMTPPPAGAPPAGPPAFGPPTVPGRMPPG
ncbi:MAG: hypothetical protein V2B18_19895 [Pseudomonadota bacterium]